MSRTVLERNKTGGGGEKGNRDRSPGMESLFESWLRGRERIKWTGIELMI